MIFSFIIETDGTLTDIKTLQDLGYGTAEEGLKLLQNCPKWQPGIKDKKPVRVQYTLPIMLNLEGDKKIGSLHSNLKIDSNQPLYLLDGKEIKQSEISAIDANTIKSIDVIRSDQTAQYGEKGKNGVVKLQLKKPGELSRLSLEVPVKEINQNTNKLSPVVVVGYNTNTINMNDNSVPSFNGLLIIDGKETPSSNLKSINPETIQSISILNNDEATKKYGAKGKNGVMIITSKK
ncbi:Regulatory sensor-transducer, BlaR1/MecR1 family [Arcticibacter svalbardensis MN12-7]|uniref:Regulatory sensor-transducer, BlaR1/MecR1 family n=1 Tax=Arcticibacter svalbardensis MN12-7 TaxID=1150600 RepID=R9GTA1_9SPHI|nr:TonB-dependent receptor plug domain-containing protein [Arcticibacter svalbardensis]EOR94765.1 Regulatory sensor-transducer, BlaR1/MecR1 family [Arcticibacter svalbardensis MN12-7]